MSDVSVHDDAEIVKARLRALSVRKALLERRKELQTDFSAFIRQVFRTVDPGTTYMHNWHVDVIAEYLEACRRREITRLIINMPPRALKSVSCTIAWPAWLLGHNPSERIIASSYSQALSYDHSVYTRAVMQEKWYQDVFPNTVLSSDQNEKHKFTTTKRGMRFATSTGGSVTGVGGNFLIVDDLISARQSMSDLEREAANNWFKQSFSTRLNDKERGVILIVMQRLHENDIVGELLDQGGWEHLCLPAVCERDTTIILPTSKKKIKWKQGELLHPERLTQKFLDEQEKTLGEYGYSGQYMQNPSPGEGGILKKRWWKQWPEDEPFPRCDYVIQVYDTAFEEKQENDPSARTTWGLFQGVDPYTGDASMQLLLLEAWEGRLNYPDLKKEVLRSYKEYKPHKIIVEKRSSGESLVQDMRRAQLPVLPFKPWKGSKFERAHFSSIVLERGYVWYPNRAWAQKVIKQCAEFPKCNHDDLVDTCVMSWLYMRKKYMLKLPDDDTLDYGSMIGQRTGKERKHNRRRRRGYG